MRLTPARMLACGAAALVTLAALALPGLLAAPGARAAPVAGGGRAGAAASARSGQVPAVVLIGIPGLRWSDITPAATPALWRLAESGSAGALSVTGVDTLTCAADAWLTLNSGARAIDPHPANGPCPRLPVVIPQPAGAGQHRPVQANVPDMPALVRANRQYYYQPDWGLLGAAGSGQCSTAIGQGGALALAGRSGRVARYLPGPAGASRLVLRSCSLTVADLGALPGQAGAGPGGAAEIRARSGALRAADRMAAGIIARAPPGAVVVLAGLGDDQAPHFQAIIVSGPGYRGGLLTASSTRQPGLVQLTDLTRSVLTWLGRKIPAASVGSLIGSSGRGSLTSTVRMLIGQDTAAQVDRASITTFMAVYAVTEIVVFGLIALLLRGGEPERRRRRTAAYRTAGVAAAAVPAGTFLASLAPWPLLPHPALVLYGLALAWAALIAAAGLAGPWRRDPFGPPGFVAAVTIAVIGLDVMTGSHLQRETPFGLAELLGGRFYGVGNNALGVYGQAGILCATWAAIAAGRGGGRRRALAAAGGIALCTVVASGWPGFGAKVGGTISMVPAFLLLLAAIAGLRITPWRALIAAVSGVALIAAFAVINYLAPRIGPSDIGAFAGHVLHGGAGPILHRKVSSNLHSLTESWLAPVVPVVAIATGAMIAWPARLHMRLLAGGSRRVALLRPALTAMWLAAVLGWLVDDSGISVAAAAMPVALPLAVVLVTGIAAAGDGQGPGTVGPQAESGLVRRGAQDMT